MKIENLRIENFRHFESLEIDFHPELTVIIAQNGQGKSSILDAAASLLSVYTRPFEYGKTLDIAPKNARFVVSSETGAISQQFPIRVSADIKASHHGLSVLNPDVTRERNSPKGTATIKDASYLSMLGELYRDRIQADQGARLPIVSYYSTSRRWASLSGQSPKNIISTGRDAGYEDCFVENSGFKQVQRWLPSATLANLQKQQMPDTYKELNIDQQIQGITNAVHTALKDHNWKNFHYSLTLEELAVTNEDNISLPVSLLSDGVQAIVSIVSDLAWRCVKLNPHLGKEAPLQTEGIVMIDEVDMHLHPEWQQTIIQSLRSAFPKVQFIVTTHSPQVLSTVPRECIRTIGLNTLGAAICAEPLAPSYGEPSGDILQSIMNVDPQPPVPEKRLLEELTSLVDQGEYKSSRAQELLEQLSTSLNKHHPQLEKIQRSIRRQEVLNG